ncbi:uncharacterized protein K452DRAFT_315629 [Neofusicoccum parvum]|nr:uncharacterized protein K452DRAFT_315629 [Neofusicoccum parvum]
MSTALMEYFVAGFNIILPKVSEELHIAQASKTWPANAFSLVVACFLVVFGRFADMYGGYAVYMGGITWFTIWSFIAGWSQNEIMIDVCRAFQGLGPAAFLPTGLMLLGSFYRPGPRKNMSMGIYGAMAPVGFYLGIFFAGITAQYTTWRWWFFIGSALCLSTLAVAYFSIPSHVHRGRREVKMDWWGAALLSSGLILVVFAITDSAHASRRWGTPYIYLTFAAGMVVLGIAFYVEGWVAENPLLPFDMFRIRYVRPLFLALTACWGSIGIFMLYATYYMTELMNVGPMQQVAWFAPMAIGGLLIASIGGLVLHRLPGTVTILVAGAAWIVPPLLFALAPPGAGYWPWVFPGMVCTAIATDTTFTVSNVFVINQMPLKRQGVAGAVIHSTVQLGISLFLGIADVIAVETAHREKRESYRIIFWFEVALSASSFAILLCFVKIKTAKSDLTVEEKEALAGNISESM